MLIHMSDGFYPNFFLRISVPLKYLASTPLPPVNWDFGLFFNLVWPLTLGLSMLDR